MKRLIIISSFLTFVSCVLDNSEIKESGWKYGSGYHIQDVLFFNGRFKIRNDTILKKDEPIALIISAKRRFDSSEILIIKSILNKKIGVYHAKF